MAIRSIDAVRIFVTDVQRAQSFYGDILGATPSLSSEAVAVFGLGQTKLIVEKADPNDEEGRGLVGRFAGVSFAVSDIAETCKSLADQNVTIVGQPERQDWGAILAHFADPDGNTLTLVQYL